MRFRRPVAAALATLIALAPAVAMPALASSVAPPAGALAADAVAAAPKVVIVVGAVQGSTASYRAKGDEIYAEAIKYTPNVVKIYSPNATWAKVKAAAQGASVFIYLGHGYGYPSPYREILSPSVQDGMGINGTGGVNDSDLKYYGESLIASDIRLAKNAVVILSGLCYAAGSSEKGDPAPTIPVARERVDNFASGWIKAGARVVIADTWVWSVVYTIQQLFTSGPGLRPGLDRRAQLPPDRAAVHPRPEPAVRRPDRPGERLLPIVRRRDGPAHHRRDRRRERGVDRLGGQQRAGAVVGRRAARPHAQLRRRDRPAQPPRPLLRERDLERPDQERRRRRPPHPDRLRPPGGPQLGSQGERRASARRRIHVEPEGQGRRRQCRGGRERTVHDRCPAHAEHRGPVLRADDPGLDQVRDDPLRPEVREPGHRPEPWRLHANRRCKGLQGRLARRDRVRTTPSRSRAARPGPSACTSTPRRSPTRRRTGDRPVRSSARR